MEDLEEFTQCECNQVWPLEETEAIWPDAEDAYQADGPECADLSMVFFLKSAWKSKKHHNDAAVRPPKCLTSGKHGYRIRKWVK